MSDIEILLRELIDKVNDVENKVDKILDIVSPDSERKEVDK